MKESEQFLPLKDMLIIEEYKACRERISKEIDSINQIEFLAFAAVGAITIFILEKMSYTIYKIGGMLIVFSIYKYGRMRYDAHRLNIKIHENYIKTHIEPKLQESHLGMMKYYDSQKSQHDELLKEDGDEPGFLKITRIAYWRALLGIGIMIFIFSITFGPASSLK